MVYSDIFVDGVSIQGCRSKHYNCILICKTTVFTHLNVFLTDAPTMKQLLNVTVEESKNVTKECNEAAGTHPLNFAWKNVKTGQVTKGKLLNISNITRNQSGEYRCIANNTCGNESTTMFINVQCKIILVAFFDTSLYWQGLVMFNFNPFYVSKHIEIIMSLVCSFMVVLLVPRVKCPFCKPWLIPHGELYERWETMFWWPQIRLLDVWKNKSLPINVATGPYGISVLFD